MSKEKIFVQTLNHELVCKQLNGNENIHIYCKKFDKLAALTILPNL